MSVDDLLYSTIGLNQDYYERMWNLYLPVFPPEFDFHSLSPTDIEAVKARLFVILDYNNNPDLKNSIEMENFLNAARLP